MILAYDSFHSRFQKYTQLGISKISNILIEEQGLLDVTIDIMIGQINSVNRQQLFYSDNL